MYSKVYGVVEFKYAARVFDGANRVAMATKSYAKINQNCTYFSSVQGMETMFACTVGFPGSANSNMLTKILRKQTELPWQQNLDKKMHRFQFCTRYSDNFYVYDRVFGVVEFKYAV